MLKHYIYAGRCPFYYLLSVQIALWRRIFGIKIRKDVSLDYIDVYSYKRQLGTQFKNYKFSFNKHCNESAKWPSRSEISYSTTDLKDNKPIWFQILWRSNCKNNFTVGRRWVTPYVNTLTTVVSCIRHRQCDFRNPVAFIQNKCCATFIRRDGI